MSANIVVPDSIISSAASRVPMRTMSGETVLASAGKMYLLSQSINARSSARPRYMTIGAWVCVLMRPGSTMSSLAAIVSLATNVRAMASGVSTPTIVEPSIATAPGDSIWCAAFWVMTKRPTTMSDTCRAVCPATMTPAPRAHATSNRFTLFDCTARSTRHALGISPTPLPCIVKPVPLHLVDHPLAHDALATLRDKRTTPEHFRQAAMRISVLLVAEALRDVPTKAITVDTPLGPADAKRVGRDVVVVPVLRAGLGMLDAVLAL